MNHGESIIILDLNRERSTKHRFKKAHTAIQCIYKCES
jgi:hypothetical protein